MKRVVLIVSVLFIATGIVAQQPQGGVTGLGIQAITDNFMRVDANPLSGNWHIDSIAQPLQIATFKCLATAPSVVNVEYNNAISYPANQKAAITTATLGADDYSGPVVRWDGSSNGYRVIAGGAHDANLYIQKETAGTAVTIGATVGYTFSANDKIELDVSGTSTTTLTVFINGVMTTTRTDSTMPFTSGNPGIFIDATGSGTTVSLFCGGTSIASC